MCYSSKNLLHMSRAGHVQVTCSSLCRTCMLLKYSAFSSSGLGTPPNRKSLSPIVVIAWPHLHRSECHTNVIAKATDVLNAYKHRTWSLQCAGVCAEGYFARQEILRKYVSVRIRIFNALTRLFPGEIPSMSGLLQANFFSSPAAMLEHTHAPYEYY